MASSAARRVASVGSLWKCRTADSNTLVERLTASRREMDRVVGDARSLCSGVLSEVLIIDDKRQCVTRAKMIRVCIARGIGNHDEHEKVQCGAVSVVFWSQW